MNWITRVNRHAGEIPVFGVPVELLSFNYQWNLADNVPHRHTYFEVCLVGEHGAGIFTVQNKPHLLKPGTLFFARPGVIHQIQNTQPEGMELFWVSFAWPLHGKTDPLSGETRQLLDSFARGSVLTTEDSTSVRALWNTLKTVSEMTDCPGKDLQLLALIQSLLLSIAQAGGGHELATSASPEVVPENLWAKMAVRFVHDNLSGHLGVDQIAAQIAVSPRHLNRLFREFTGVSPAAYVEKARIARAKYLLLNTGRSIKEVAATVGFPDHHHFSRVFVRVTGMAPSKFRDNGGSPAVIRAPGDLV